MAGYVYNPELRAWRGRSYKKGGMRFAELRSRTLLRAQIESLIEEEKEKDMVSEHVRFDIVGPEYEYDGVKRGGVKRPLRTVDTLEAAEETIAGWNENELMAGETPTVYAIYRVVSTRVK